MITSCKMCLVRKDNLSTIVKAIFMNFAVFDS